MDGASIFAIVFTIVLIIIIIILIIYLIPKQNLNKECSTTDNCSLGFVCQIDSNLLDAPSHCKADAGTTCSISDDCANGLSCQGKVCTKNLIRNTYAIIPDVIIPKRKSSLPFINQPPITENKSVTIEIKTDLNITNKLPEPIQPVTELRLPIAPSPIVSVPIVEVGSIKPELNLIPIDTSYVVGNNHIIDGIPIGNNNSSFNHVNITYSEEYPKPVPRRIVVRPSIIPVENEELKYERIRVIKNRKSIITDKRKIICQCIDKKLCQCENSNGSSRSSVAGQEFITDGFRHVRRVVESNKLNRNHVPSVIEDGFEVRSASSGTCESGSPKKFYDFDSQPDTNCSTEDIDSKRSTTSEISETKGIDICSYSDSILVLQASGKIIKCSGDGSQRQIKNNISIQRLQVFSGVLYAVCNGSLFELDTNTYDDSNWSWDKCSWNPPIGIIYTNVSSRDNCFWVQTCDIGFLYDRDLRLLEEVSTTDTTVRIYGIDRHNYLDVDIERCTSISYPSYPGRKPTDNVCNAVIGYDGLVKPLTRDHSKIYKDIRLVNWKPIFVRR